jgi:hypothetical protein
MEKITKVKSKYEVHLADGTVETFDTLEKAEKKMKSMRGTESEYYFIRKDYTGKKVVGEYLIS